MTKTKAAEIMERSVRAWIRENGSELTVRLCEERINELNHPIYEGRYDAEAAKIANPKTVYRMAKKELERMEWA